jgi:hypothetical protein
MITIPDIIIADLDFPVATSLRPAFDAIWNAYGYERSPSYRANGEWKPI